MREIITFDYGGDWSNRRVDFRQKKERSDFPKVFDAVRYSHGEDFILLLRPEDRIIESWEMWSHYQLHEPLLPERRPTVQDWEPGHQD